MRQLLFLAIIFTTATLFSCKKKKIVPTVGKTQLVFPLPEEICSTGTVVSEQQTRINFSWMAPVAAESYTLVVKNLLSNAEQTSETSATSTAITLTRGVPYAWHVVARSSRTDQTTQSDTWKFYVAGSGTTSYAPFPATLVSPKYSETITASTVSFSWKGSDPDNDIVSYDLYLGIGGPETIPPLLYRDLKTEFVNAVPISVPNAFYAWRIVSKDAAGNSSSSEIFVFRAK